MRSQPSTSFGLVVTLTRSASAPSILPQSSSIVSSARQAELSERASTRTSPSVEAEAARPSAIAPLPATAGVS